MKKQISVLFAVFFSFCLISCQKEDTTSLKENLNSTAISEKTNIISNKRATGVPFKGIYTTSFVMLQPPPIFIQKVSGTGNASHLGRSTFEAVSSVNLTTQPPFAVNGTRTITAANGDKLFTTFTGNSTPLEPGLNRAELHETITGGTGRFQNASGNFDVVAINNQNTSTFTADFDGFINY